MMHDLGVTFMRRDKSDKVPGIEDGIEAVRRNLPKMWIDERLCTPLIKSLENYRQEYDPKRQIYKDKPVHDQHSHAADAMRYLCVGLNRVKTGTSAEDLEKRFRDTVYGGDQSNYPSVFRNDLPPY
jgi:hypothetical protein